MQKPGYYLIFAAWLTSAVATLGSLFFSDVMNFIPCTMCWYQRICMYPLVLLFGAALYRHSKDILLYTLPLTVIGWLFAFYHYLVQMNIIPQSASPCVQGIPCTARYINLAGFITIPLLSLAAFSLILAFTFMYSRRTVDENQ